MDAEDATNAIEGEDLEDVQENLEELDTEGVGVMDFTQSDPLEVLYKFHPETILDYAEAVAPSIPLQNAPPVIGKDGSSSDPKHRSQPFLTVYEQTKILGFRANQLAQGARPYIVVPEQVSSTLEIAKLELAQRRLPYIIKRPMPDGSFEHWRLSDLMIL